MNKVSAILVDDEESARDILEQLLSRYCPTIELKGKFSNMLDAVEYIKSYPPELVFLDIEMPKYAGYEIVQFFDEIPFEIIFVTAYDKYAMRAFEVAAIDYLLKPLDIDRLQESVNRVCSSISLRNQVQKLSLLKDTLQSNSVNNIIVREKGYQHIIETAEIIAIEAQESYSNVHTSDKKYVVSKNLKHFENLFMDNHNFIRVHKSWIISKNHILKYSKSDLNILLQGDISAKLSKYKKTDFEAAIVAQ